MTDVLVYYSLIFRESRHVKLTMLSWISGDEKTADTDQFGSRPISIHVNIYINLVNGRLNIYVFMVNIAVRWPSHVILNCHWHKQKHWMVFDPCYVPLGWYHSKQVKLTDHAIRASTTEYRACTECICMQGSNILFGLHVWWMILYWNTELQ